MISRGMVHSSSTVKELAKRFEMVNASLPSESGISMTGVPTSSKTNLANLSQTELELVKTEDPPSEQAPSDQSTDASNTSTSSSESSSSSNKTSTTSDEVSPVVPRTGSVPASDSPSTSNDSSELIRMLPVSPPQTPPRALGDMEANSLMFIKETFRPNESGTLVRYRQG